MTREEAEVEIDSLLYRGVLSFESKDSQMILEGITRGLEVTQEFSSAGKGSFSGEGLIENTGWGMGNIPYTKPSFSSLLSWFATQTTFEEIQVVTALEFIVTLVPDFFLEVLPSVLPGDEDSLCMYWGVTSWSLDIEISITGEIEWFCYNHLTQEYTTSVRDIISRFS